MSMDRTPDEVINAMEFCLLNGRASAFLIGDNEMARLVLEWRELKDAREASDVAIAFEKGRLAGINEARSALSTTNI